MPADPQRILLVKLSAMGDIIHALPVACSLKHRFPQCQISWIVKSKWTVLLEGNPYVDEVIAFDRTSLAAMLDVRRVLRERKFDVAVDCQGLVQSSLLARISAAKQRWGFDASELKEKQAALLYTNRVAAPAKHVVDKCLAIAEALGAKRCLEFPIPAGRPEGTLPDGPFVLAAPLAGWASKQWPLEYYKRLASLLKVPLVLNGPPGTPHVGGTLAHVSGIPGLIDATRRALAVVGIDSGPLHLAAALGKPGVAIFGPTDPARNGPYGNTIEVLRTASAVTTYKRDVEVAASMRAISPETVFETLCRVITSRNLTPIS